MLELPTSYDGIFKTTEYNMQDYHLLFYTFQFPILGIHVAYIDTLSNNQFRGNVVVSVA
jgi:hypothetical protein